MDIVISKDDIVKHKDGGYRAGIRRRLSINPPTEGFGGKDSVKENRQGCLSRSIKRFLSTFLKCSKIQQLVEKTFSTSCGGYQSGIRRRREISRKSGSDPPPPCRCRRCRRYLSAPWPRWGRERQAGWGPGGCFSRPGGAGPAGQSPPSAHTRRCYRRWAGH